MQARTRQLSPVLLVLLLVFGALFLVRGPGRALQGSQDFAHFYAATKLWIDGGNPYDGQQSAQTMQAAGYAQPERVSNGSYYPPTLMVGLAPLGLLSWPGAKIAWLMVNLVSCAGLIYAAAYWLKLADRSKRWQCAALIVLASGTVATTMSVGQLSLLAGACICVGAVFFQQGRAYSGWLLIAFAAMIKPQIGLGYLVMLPLLRDWKSLGLVSLFILAVSAIGTGRLMVTSPTWAGDLVQNIQASQTGNSMNDASPGAPLRHHLIDLRPIMHTVLPSDMADKGAITLVALMTLMIVWRLMRLKMREHLLLSFAWVGLIFLMPVYHRYYDAVLLLPLMALAVNRLMMDRRDVLMWLVAAAMVPMLFPGPTVCHALSAKSWFPSGLADSWAWQNLVLVHHCWCLLIAAIALMFWTQQLPLPVQQAKESHLQ